MRIDIVQGKYDRNRVLTGNDIIKSVVVELEPGHSAVVVGPESYVVIHPDTCRNCANQYAKPAKPLNPAPKLVQPTFVNPYDFNRH